MGNPDAAFGLKLGDRIKLIQMNDDPCPIEPGATGTIIGFSTGFAEQVWVDWDNGRSLMLIPGVDAWEKL